ncbi:MFS transporter [Streptomyces prasinus]|uniref:MFS transporter n=1 Tax=Streptomyces prasinus TaxID=67345 RepID=UPI0006EB2C52|nr:MFS transporter [Streptomyces prasinus]
MPLPLYLLALAVFAMGTSEFMLAGLLPDISSEFDVTVGTAGVLTSAFAVGMIGGAPLVAALARNWPRCSSLLGFILVFAAAHAVGALTTSFPVLFATRVVAALANAGFLAVALTAAATLVSPDKKGRALAVLLSGTTMATIAGVPGGGAVLGTLLGWRAAFWAFAALCLPAALGILKGIPTRRVKAEATGWPALAMLAHQPVALFALVFVQGALSFALGSTLITRILYEAVGALTMAGSYATAALNIGAVAGPLIAATTLSTAAGDLGPLWASGLLVAFPLRTVVAVGRSAEVLQ